MGSMSTIAGVTNKNLAKMFTPRVPMQTSGITPEQAKVWMDIPAELKQTIDQGLDVITTNCLRDNALFLFGRYEDMCLKHVTDMQIKDKTYSKLVRGNAAIEDANPDNGVREPRSIAKSSLLGQDPWGDEEIPADPDAPEDNDTYSQLQTLLMNVQDSNYLYLTTHLRRILHKDVYINVKNAEVKYELDERGIRTSTERNRMPWAAYKEVVLDLLPLQFGLHELRILMTLNREQKESPQSWVQRLETGKRLLEEKNIKLPDQRYVQIALDYLTIKEKEQVADQVGTAAQRARLTKQKLLRKLLDVPMDEMVSLVGRVLGMNSEYRLSFPARILRQMVFTEAQAKLYFGLGGKAKTTDPKKGKNDPPEDSSKLRCEKCIKAGLRGRRAAHRTEDCNDAVRRKNVRKLKEHLKRKAQEGAGAPPKRQRQNNRNPERADQRRNSTFECAECKKAGRKYRHDPKKCKFAPGGEWHGVTKEELRKLQKKFYEDINQKRRGVAITHQSDQLQKRRKLRRGESSSSRSDGNKKMAPWLSGRCLMADQYPFRVGGDHSILDNRSGDQPFSVQNGEAPASPTPGVSTITADSEEQDLIGSDSPSTPEYTPGYESEKSKADDLSQSMSEEDETSDEEEDLIGGAEKTGSAGEQLAVGRRRKRTSKRQRVADESCRCRRIP